MDIKKEIKKEANEIIKIRRDLHKIPELGFQEKETSEYIIKKLRSFSPQVKIKRFNTGIVALFYRNNSARTIMIRADMDGLPITERKGIAYRSKHEGIMHACGHDGHMAIALIISKIISRNLNDISGNIKLVFQPAEENTGGAKMLIKSGVLADPEVDAVLGLHIWNHLPIGKIGIKSGIIMSPINHFKIKIMGKSAHGATPHKGIDAISISAQVINALQSIVSREVDPFNSCVITIGKIKGGQAYNIIASEVMVEGTVRALDKELNKKIPSLMERAISGITKSRGAEYEFYYKCTCPSVENDPAFTKLIRDCAKETVGESNVVEYVRTLGGDDISYYLQKKPGCYFFLGSRNDKKGLTEPHHNDRFDFDENCLVKGSEVLLRAITRYLG